MYFQSVFYGIQESIILVIPNKNVLTYYVYNNMIKRVIFEKYFISVIGAILSLNLFSDSKMFQSEFSSDDVRAKWSRMNFQCELFHGIMLGWLEGLG